MKNYQDLTFNDLLDSLQLARNELLDGNDPQPCISAADRLLHQCSVIIDHANFWRAVAIRKQSAMTKSA